MKKSKCVLAVICIIAMVATVSVSFAVWDTLSDENVGDGATFGNNVQVEITDYSTFTNAKLNLVPKDAICGPRDTYKYDNALFTVKLKDYSNKSALTFKITVVTDGNTDVSQYFDIRIATDTVNANVAFDEEKYGNGLFEGNMTIPGNIETEEGIVPGNAIFNFDMKFRDYATDMYGIENIIGRSFKIKIDILAKTA